MNKLYSHLPFVIRHSPLKKHPRRLEMAGIAKVFLHTQPVPMLPHRNGKEDQHTHIYNTILVGESLAANAEFYT